MKKVLFALCLMLFAIVVQAAEWYEGGTLHQANGLEWQQADHANKLATSADLVAAAYQRDMLAPKISNRIHGVDDIKPLAEEIVTGLDAAFEPQADAAENRKLFANQKVNESAAMLMIMMGWVNTR